MVFDYQLMFGMDKLMHFTGFAVISALLGMLIILLSEYQEVKQRISVVWITLVTIGIIEEYRQYWLPNRSTEFLDAIANIAGVTIGLALPLLFVLIVRHRRELYSKALGLYTFVLIPLLFGLLYLNERPFFTYEERLQERIRSLAALIGW